MIFIQIPSYRDSELGPTIRDALSKSKWPNDLRFGICLQDDLSTNYGFDFDDKRFRMLHFHWQESLGACWARHHAQSLYEGETYTLQLDSHHRFVEHWDEKMIQQLELCSSSKPIISTYPGSYNPDTNEVQHHLPTKIVPTYFDHNGQLKRSPVQFKPTPSRQPIPARLLAAGFLFTTGRFCEDCVYDPNMYFNGEEISLTVRAYTHGYDLFHPQEVLLWHEYIRRDKPRHWSDFVDHFENESDRETATDWSLQDVARLDQLLEGSLDHEVSREFGLGSKRTVDDYQRYSGIHFKDQILFTEAKQGCTPFAMPKHDWQTQHQIYLTEKFNKKLWRFSLPKQEHHEGLTIKARVVSLFNLHGDLIERVRMPTQATQDGRHVIESESNLPPASWISSALADDNQWHTLSEGEITDYLLL